MIHAYLIAAHSNFKQLSMLVEGIKSHDNFIFIHIDKKSETLYQDSLKKFGDMKNVHILKNRIDVNRGGLTQVYATIELLKSASRYQQIDYVSFISGQCYPIKSNKYIKDFLKKSYNKEFIEGELIGRNSWRIKQYNFFSESKYNRKLLIRVIDFLLRKTQMFLRVRRSNLKNFEIYKGSSWFTITQDCMQYILKFIHENEEYLKQFKYTYCPDESFFHTIIMNSDFRKKRKNDDLFEIDWENAILGSPRTFQSSDISMLLKSKKLFARKFDFNLDEEVIRILNKSNEEKNNVKYNHS